MRAWRSAQRVRRGVVSPLLGESAWIGASTEGEMPVSVISRLVMSKPNPSSKGFVHLYCTGNGERGTERSVGQSRQ